MTPVLEHPVAHLLARPKASSSRSIIALAGLPGAGKSTLAARLAEEVNAGAGAGTMMALSMDGFHLTKAQLQQQPDAEAAFARRGAPWTFDAPALTEHLRALQTADGKAVEWPDFQHEIGDPVPGAHRVPPTTRIVLVEGLYLLLRDEDWAAVSAAFDERWYLDTPLDISLERLISRHMNAWGLSRDAAEARVATNDGLNAQIVWDSQHLADWRLLPQTRGEDDSR